MRWKLAALTLVAAGGLVAVAYGVDHARGVSQATLDDSTPVVVHAPAGDLRTTAAALGLTVDVPATRAALRDARDAGPVDWFRGLVGRRQAALVTTIDEGKVREVVRANDPSTRQDPVEPAVVGTADGIEVKAGRAGHGLDADAVADAVQAAARHAGEVVETDVEPTRLPPRHTMADARALARRAGEIIDGGITVHGGQAETTLKAATLRAWVRSTDELELALDADEVVDGLAERLPEATQPAVDASIQIQDGRVVIVPGVDGARCCAEAAADRLVDALLEGDDEVTVPLRPIEPERTTEDLRALEIVEPIGSFTTRHPAGQPRVTNIHRIADLVRGTIIGPGGRFSINDKVGERTTEKGFVVDHAIENGVFVDTVGGGVSQFATTLFNAAFFAGLDIPTYQSHSIYISRYPYGREATMSWPRPDLVIANDTPYAVFVDTAYTSTSITVTLWSTRHATGEQTNQSTSPVGQCTRVKTERTRRYVDGTVKTDDFFATYRPAEGVKC